MIEAHIPIDADWFQNTDFTFPFTIFQADDATPLDITGFALSWTLRKRVTDTVAVLTKTTGSGITIAGVYNVVPATNLQRATVAIADDETALIPAGLYYHELKRTDPGSEAILAQGRAILRAAVHH